MAGSKTFVKFDWLLIFMFIALVTMGWINIYSASLSDTAKGFWDFDQIYGKQMIWIGLSVIIIIFVLAVESKFYERFASVIYIISLLTLLGLFVFGKTIAGSTSWYDFGGISIQPSEFAKATTALALAKYVSDIQTNMQDFKNQIGAFIILVLPAILIILQPDPGSALIYAAFVFPLYREGLHGVYLLFGLFAVMLFVSTLAFGAVWVAIGVALLAGLLFYRNRKKRPKILKYVFIVIGCIAFAFSVSYIFNNVFKQHHRDRFNIVLGKEVDSRGIGYNTNQSEIAISNGGWLGKGWTQGTQTKGNFVPEQHTDYIFSTVGEEWGFVGSMIVVLLFVGLILRIIFKAEKQKSQFGRVYGYSVAAILFFHFFVNIGMVSGIFPTVGIPLPFFSYGGSALWGFTILLFIFVKLDGSNYHYA
ncbi:rod shape-determining protein RodA [Aequorivita lipolytica]|uniref:Cell wall polymerase n=1 Tax=Aequorivita lipolytica TaxID=153267 RepID=A0A5C6YQW0_9FLAO|nr:rod shape-determining protein RodA [Aequorivita lipolytica]TXD69780.1 rod shape-determining protein RodA [Aequorivita lipolytica]SRX50410.1 Peptidoglycan glycosyltransferase MrdB [Aequorivita lipolytica]